MSSAMATLQAAKQMPDWDIIQSGIVIAIGVGTGAIYTLQRRIKFKRMPHHIPQDRRIFIEKYSGMLLGGWCLCIATWFIVFRQDLLNWAHLLVPASPFLIILSALALGYASNPFSNDSNGWRDISRFKLPVIAITWGLATVWIPSIMCGSAALEFDLIARVLAQSLLIAGLTVPFDVRDMAVDPPSMNTVPQRIGPKSATYLAIALLATGAGIFLFIGNAVAPLCTIACAMPCVVCGQIVRKEWFYSLVLDGCLIVQGFVIIFWV
jgi:hypothetical protein